jgi:hypothetical protein
MEDELAKKYGVENQRPASRVLLEKFAIPVLQNPTLLTERVPHTETTKTRFEKAINTFRLLFNGSLANVPDQLRNSYAHWKEALERFNTKLTVRSPLSSLSLSLSPLLFLLNHFIDFLFLL